MMEKKIVVSDNDKGQRLDRFLSGKLASFSRTKIHSLIEKGCILVDGKTKKPSFNFKGGEEITVNIVDSDDSVLQPYNFDLNILHEDDEACFLQYARKVKKVVTDVPLMLVGGLRSPRRMERILSAGDAEMVSLCRPLIREPDLVKQWKEGRRRKADCISCNGCQKYRDEPVRCIVLDSKKQQLRRKKKF